MLVNDTGRPDNVYGKPCPQRFLEHEVAVTEAELLLGPFDRHGKVGKATPDGLFVRDGIRYALEVDNQSMTAKQMRQKWKLFLEAKFDGFILVVCHTRGRLKRLMAGAGLVRDRAFFSRLRWLKSGVARPWIDRKGKRSAI